MWAFSSQKSKSLKSLLSGELYVDLILVRILVNYYSTVDPGWQFVEMSINVSSRCEKNILEIWLNTSLI